ncbi:MAG: hypothetical protein K1X54_08240 [Flavobacteriales bacterium]|nr:hypothetical protein [Flavobacteriales bacterium]
MKWYEYVLILLGNSAFTGLIVWFLKLRIESSLKNHYEKALTRYDRYHGRISYWVEELNSLVVEVEEKMAGMTSTANTARQYREISEEMSERMLILHKSYRKAFVYLSEDSIKKYNEFVENIDLMKREALALSFAMNRPDGSDIVERKMKLKSNFIEATTQIIVAFQQSLKDDLTRE